jgi:hypothetical protein
MINGKLRQIETMVAGCEDGLRVRQTLMRYFKTDRNLRGRGATSSEQPQFGFSIPKNGTLPLEGAVPSWIDHRRDPTTMEEIPNLGARLKFFSLVRPDYTAIQKLYRELCINHAPSITLGPETRYRADI